MNSSVFSHSPYVFKASKVFATVVVGFGLNAFIRPTNALALFTFKPPVAASDKKLVDSLMIIYGVRDIFLGVAVFAAAYFRERNTLGCLLFAGAGVAFVDGAICRVASGKGEWHHWALIPFLFAGGLGAFDIL